MTFAVETGGRKISLSGLCTGVFETRNSKWLVIQAQFALPATQAKGESVPA
jgi:hypothetical protein